MSEIECWSCKNTIALDKVAENDGDCPFCSAEIDMHIVVEQLQKQLVDKKRECQEYITGNTNLLGEVTRLGKESRAYKQQLAESQVLIADISNMCIGEITMNYKLDAQYIGELIYKVTGMTNQTD